MALASEQFQPDSLAVGGGHVYWTGSYLRKVLRVSLEDRSVEILTRGAPLVHGVAPMPGVVYWNEERRILRWTGSGEPTELAIAPSAPARFAVDARGLYWLNWHHGHVLGLEPPDGGAPRTLARDQDRPFGIALDATSVYWTTQGGSVMRAARDGSVAPVALAARQAEPMGIAVDDDHVYWVNKMAGTVLRVPKQGGASQVLARSSVGLRALAVDDRYVYWTSPDDGVVVRVSKQGGSAEVLASGQQRPFDVAVDGRAVYWVNQHPRGAVMMLEK
jgi:sugar lactone lactonase YvrE